MNESFGSRPASAPRDEATLRLKLEAAKTRVKELNELARHASVSDAEVERVEDIIYALENELAGRARAVSKPVEKAPVRAPVAEEQRAAATESPAPRAEAAAVAPEAPRKVEVRVPTEATPIPQEPAAPAVAPTPREEVVVPEATPAPIEASVEMTPSPTEEKTPEPEVQEANGGDGQPPQPPEESPAGPEHPTGSLEDKAPTFDHVNPDRVRVVNRPQEVVTEVHPARTVEVAEKVIIKHGRPTIEWVKTTRAGKWFRGLIAAAAIAGGTIAVNSSTEYAEGGAPSSAARAERVAGALDTINMETMTKQVQNEVCGRIHPELMHRFMQRDANGEDSFNPGGFVMPFAIEVTKSCTAKVDIEVHVPYDFARTFKEIAATHPERRAEMIQKLSHFITQQVQNKLVINGFAGFTDSSLVYDRVHNTVTSHRVVDLGKLDVKNMTVTGTASAEAAASHENAGAPSLTGGNRENAALAQDRLQDSLPLLQEAFRQAGVKPEVIQNIHAVSYEKNLVESQVKELAAIARQVALGESVQSDDEMAYQLVQEINKGNSDVIKRIEAKPEFAKKIKEYITDSRGVNVTFTAETTHKETKVIPLVLPPLLLFLLLPALRRGRTKELATYLRREKQIPAVTRSELVDMPVAVSRRLFSEATPSTLNKDRSFTDLYAETDLAESPQDTRLLLEHMLIEEVLPSLDPATKEPLINYETIVEQARQYLASDTRPGEVRKGAYPTTGDAQREITDRLISMWEKHDVATYPMEGIDLKDVINYHHSPEVIYWAKTLAEHLTSVASRTMTREEFREELYKNIDELKQSRIERGRVDSNNFVQSEMPRAIGP